MDNFTDDEKYILLHIIRTGGEDYDIWPRITDDLMPILRELEKRDIIAVMGNGDILIIDKSAEQQIRKEIKETK